MSKDKKPVLGEHTKKEVERRKENEIPNKESIGRNVGNTVKPADANALKKDQEAKVAERMKTGKENQVKTWAEKTQKQETPQQQTQHKPSALQQKAQEQLMVQGVKQQEQRSKETTSKEKVSALQQKAQKDAQVRKQVEVKKSTPVKGKTK